MRWLHRVRLYPKANQVTRLRFALDVTRQLYNALLDQRRYLWTSRRVTITAKSQYAELTALRAEDQRIAAVYRESEDAVLHRLDLAFGAFFRRLSRGQAPGYPRFKPASRWRQLEYPHGNRALKLSPVQDEVRIPGVGTVGARAGCRHPQGCARTLPQPGRSPAHEGSAAVGPGQGTREERAAASRARGGIGAGAQRRDDRAGEAGGALDDAQREGDGPTARAQRQSQGRA